MRKIRKICEKDRLDMDSARINEICRMCLSQAKFLYHLFQTLPDKNVLSVIRNNVRLDIAEEDHLTKMICKQCISKLKTIAKHVELFQETDRRLREAPFSKKNTLNDDCVNNVPDEYWVSKGSEIIPSVDTVENTKDLIDATIVNYDTQPSIIGHPETTNAAKFSPETSPNRIAEELDRSHSEAESEDGFELECDDVETTHNATDSSPQMGITPSQEDLETVMLICDKDEKSEAMLGKKKKCIGQRKRKRILEDECTVQPMLADFKCYICSINPLSSRKALIEHLATHVDKVPYTCERCVMETIVLTRVRTLNTHMKMHEQPIKCDYCDRRYSNAAGKYYHTHTYHLGGGAPCLVNCEICGKQYGSEVALKQHMKYHTTTLKCSKCEMVFNHPNKRRNHELTHNENRGYECVVCQRVLQTIESYDVHLKKHSQERSYKCTLCPKKFNTSFNLILHLKVHAKNYNYRPARSWVDHYTILSRVPLHYKCNHCERYSTDKVNNMISHLQAHFKEFECDQCKRKFATAKQLRAHYTTHTGERSEMCQHCGKCFSTKNNLRIHLKSHERGDGMSNFVVKSEPKRKSLGT